jgi:hypothetical protein
MPNPLSPQKALIFRITHRDNIPWVLENGVHCRNSNRLDPNFVSIGNESLIHDRQQVVVPIAPGGTLSDYVPFYFTPYSRDQHVTASAEGGNGGRIRFKTEYRRQDHLRVVF